MTREIRILIATLLAIALLPWVLKWTYVCYLLARDTLT